VKHNLRPHVRACSRPVARATADETPAPCRCWWIAERASQKKRERGARKSVSPDPPRERTRRRHEADTSQQAGCWQLPASTCWLVGSSSSTVLSRADRDWTLWRAPSLAFPFVMLVSTIHQHAAWCWCLVCRCHAHWREQARTCGRDCVSRLSAGLALGAISHRDVAGDPVIFQWMGGRDKMLADDSLMQTSHSARCRFCIPCSQSPAMRFAAPQHEPARGRAGWLCGRAHRHCRPVADLRLGAGSGARPAGAGWGLVIPFAVAVLS